MLVSASLGGRHLSLGLGPCQEWACLRRFVLSGPASWAGPPNGLPGLAQWGLPLRVTSYLVARALTSLAPASRRTTGGPPMKPGIPFTRVLNCSWLLGALVGGTADVRELFVNAQRHVTLFASPKARQGVAAGFGARKIVNERCGRCS